MNSLDVILKRLLMRINFITFRAREELFGAVNFLVRLNLRSRAESFAAWTSDLRKDVVELSGVRVKGEKCFEILVADVTDEAGGKRKIDEKNS